MRKFLIALGIFVVLGLLFGGMAVGNYNGLVDRSQGVDAQWAQVESVYQRRADLVPNLVATVAGAADFEKSTLLAITEARASIGTIKLPQGAAPTDPSQLAAFEQAQNQLGSALSRLLVVVERYPELKATANFQTFQAQLEGTENRISVERGRYNEVARDYNAAIKRIPTVFFASALGFNVKTYFSAQPDAKDVPPVDFR